MSLPQAARSRRSSIVTRITLVLVLLVVVAAALSGWLVYRGSADQALANARREMRHTLQLAELRLQAFSSTMAADIDFLGDNAPVNDWAALADTVDSAAMQVVIERTALLFNSFIRSRPEYAQVRFIVADSLGMEAVRFDRAGNVVARTPDSLLQAKGDRDYFLETIALPVGGRYHSRIDLNKEHGAIARPFMPTMRSAAPVRSPKGKLVGIVIINADLRPLFQELLAMAPPDGKLMLADAQDELILHPDTSKTFRFEFGPTDPHPLPVDGDAGVEDPSIWPEVLIQAYGLDVSSTGQHYTIAMERSTSALLAGLREVRDRQMLTVGAVAVACIVLGLLFARGIAGRLDRLTKRVEAYAEGTASVPLPIERADEIGRLARTVQHMQERIDARMKDLEQARDRAQRAEQVQKDFLANMSHELRTPLNAIIGMGQQLADGAPDEAQRERAAIVLRSAQRMQALVGDLLEHARLADGRVTVRNETFAPAQVLNDVLAVHVVAARAKGLALLAEVEQLPEACTGDPLRLHQVIDNLLGNAIKFTAKGQVKLAARFAQGELVVAVSDTGAGLSPEEQKRVFARFERAAASEGKEGVGLGLAITQALVNAMAGSLQLESAVGLGSTFTVRIPMPHVGPHFDPVASKAQTKAPADLRVLYVEDVGTNRMLMADWATAWQWKLDLATGSEEALALCREHAYDLFLIDLDLGDDMKGTELALRIHGMARHRYVPAIAVTAFADADHDAQVRQAGLNDRITKPIDRNELATKAAFWSDPSADAAIGLAGLLEQYGAQGEKAITVLQQFRKEFAKHRTALHQALANKDEQTLARVRHQLKPHWQLLGLTDGLAALDALGTDVMAHDMSHVDPWFDRCDRAMLGYQANVQQGLLADRG